MPAEVIKGYLPNGEFFSANRVIRDVWAAAPPDVRYVDEGGWFVDSRWYAREVAPHLPWAVKPDLGKDFLERTLHNQRRLINEALSEYHIIHASYVSYCEERNLERKLPPF